MPIYLLFSSKSFIVLALILRSSIHSELISVGGIKSGTNFTLLHVTVELFQHYLLKMPVLS